MCDAKHSLVNLTRYRAVSGMKYSTSCTFRSYVLTTAPQGALDENPQATEAAWNSELCYRVSVLDEDSVKDFLDLFVPCSQFYTSIGDLHGVFADHQPRKGGELVTYSTLVCNSIRYYLRTD